MAIANELIGLELTGRGRSPRVWRVTEKIAAIQGHSPGFFSVAYKCVDEAGAEAFLKASDLDLVLSSAGGSILKKLSEATQAHTFEREVLEHCRGNRMDRVVTALDFGEETFERDGKTEFLFFLVFELADGDLRKRVTNTRRVDLLWTVSAMHEYAVAVSQLHAGSVFHNDIKPANALTFSDERQKIADLGRATTPLMTAAHDYGQCVGDTRFASPEQLYALTSPIVSDDRFVFYKAGDLYNLGSLAHYLLTGVSVTSAVISRLPPEYRPPNDLGDGWRDDVKHMLPYWSDIVDQLITEARESFEHVADGKVREQLEGVLKIIRELCEPDWKLRGGAANVELGSRYSLARYITKLDLARTRLLVSANSAK